MDFGSTFTSSASGSCKRRAIEMAPRMVRSRSGNSCRAISDAEYTDAPDSLTVTLKILVRFVSRRKSCTKAADSREAVPLPMAMACTLWRAMSEASVLRAPATSFLGSNG